jgi:hypothetical protein
VTLCVLGVYRACEQVFQHCLKELQDIVSTRAINASPACASNVTTRSAGNYSLDDAELLLQQCVRDVATQRDDSIVLGIVNGRCMGRSTGGNAGTSEGRSIWLRMNVLASLSVLPPLQLGDQSIVDIARSAKAYLAPQDALFTALLGAGTAVTANTCELHFSSDELRRHLRARNGSGIFTAGVASAARANLVLSEFTEQLAGAQALPWPDLADCTMTLISTLYASTRCVARGSDIIVVHDPELLAVIASYQHLIVPAVLTRELRLRGEDLLRSLDRATQPCSPTTADNSAAWTPAAKYLTVVVELLCAVPFPARSLAEILRGAFDDSLCAMLYICLVTHGPPVVAIFSPLLRRLAVLLLKVVPPAQAGALQTGPEVFALTSAFWAIVSAVSDAGCTVASFSATVQSECVELRRHLHWTLRAVCVQEGAEPLTAGVLSMYSQRIAVSWYGGVPSRATTFIGLQPNDSAPQTGIKYRVTQVDQAPYCGPAAVLRPSVNDLLRMLCSANTHGSVSNPSKVPEFLELLSAHVRDVQNGSASSGAACQLYAALLVDPYLALVG